MWGNRGFLRNGSQRPNLPQSFLKCDWSIGPSQAVNRRGHVHMYGRRADTSLALKMKSVFEQTICPENALQSSQMTLNTPPQDSYRLPCSYPKCAPGITQI